MAYEPRPLNDLFWYFHVPAITTAENFTFGVPENEQVYIVKALGTTGGAIDANADFLGQRDSTTDADLDFQIPTAGSGAGVVAEESYALKHEEDQDFRITQQIRFQNDGTPTGGVGHCCIVLRRDGGAGV